MIVINRWFSITLASFILVSFHHLLLAKTITIKLDGSGNYTKIQAGINAANTGDTVLVYPGTFTENLDFNGKNVVLGSLFLITADTTFISKTIIDGNKAGSVILMQNRENVNAAVVGLTIQNSASANAGISLLNSGVTIKNCNIIKNAGEGIYALNDSYSIIENNRISNNGSFGVYFGYGARGIVRSNSIIGNRDGISIYLSSPSTIEKNIISSNSGMGIDVDASGATIRFNLINNNGFQGIYCGRGTQIINCTIANNLAGIILQHNSSVKILNSIIWGNQNKELALDPNANGTWDVTYSLVKGGWPGTGNISTDPLFRGGTPYDYHLTSLSPCIDAGDPASPIDSDGTRADMGAFYFDKNSPKKTFVSGNVKGTWTKANSPYCVVDHITVQAGETLIIEPGVQVRFQGHYMFIVNGLLKAVGTEADSILFTRDLPIEGNKWWGLRFINAADSCKLRYCIIEYGKASGRLGWPETKGGGIYCENSFPAIQNCTIRNNEAEDDGGGIDVDNPARPDSIPLMLSSCVITNNKGRVGGGGGVNATGSSLIVLKNVLIAGCTALRGGGVYTTGPLRVINCTISNNVAEQQGGGIGTLGSTVSVSNSIIFFNQAPNGGQIFIDPSFVKTLSVSYSDVQNGWSGVGNINANPLFVDIVRGDYHLQANSPCINTGDPASPLDPDGTRADMGALYFKQTPVDQIPPTTPQGLTAIAGNRQITLKWRQNTEPDFLRYRIYRGTSPNPITKVDSTNSIADTTKTFTGLSNGTKYYFRLTAVDQNLNQSGFSDEVSATPTLVDLPPAPPKNLTATAGDKQITLKWDANSELDLLRYRIYGGIAPNPTTAIDSVLAALGTTKIITGLNNGTKYYFRITAVDLTLNVSGYSNEVSATPTTGPAAPNAPTNLAATPVSSTQINLTWSDNSSNETSFEIERKAGAGGTYAVIATRPGDASTGADNYSNTGLSPNTAYFYRVRAVLNTVTPILYSNYSNEISATTFPAIPAAPSNLAASAISNSQIRLSWNATGVTGEEGFRIYRSTSAGVAIVAGNLVGSVGINIETFTDTGLSATNTYYYKVVAFNVSGNSAPSNEASATPAGDKTPPTLSAVSYAQKVNLNTDATVALSITDVSGIKNATLYYRSGGAASFSSRAMTLQTGSTYTQTIPAAAVTNRGVEFYVTAEDNFNNFNQSLTYPIQVYCPNGIANPSAQPSGKEASAYRIFSIPLDLDNKSPAAFLNANSSLGDYDNTKYRWYGLERSTQRLQEYPNFGSLQMSPDMGFALLTTFRNVKLKTGSGTTVVTTKPYNLALPAGWSLIGNPFNYNIPFDSLRVSAGTFELWRFDGDWQINTAGLEPWKGYAIWLSQAATFSIRAGLAGLKSTASFYAVENNAANNWLIQITAENGRSASRFNFVGQNELANDDEDQFDLHQPLNLADGVELVFNQQLTTDIRQSSANGHTWELTCRLNPADEMLSLAFEGIPSVPPNFEIFLIDRETQTAYDLRRNPRLQFATRHLTEKRLQLIAGTKTYLDSQKLASELHPSNYVLLQNFPNPFNPATQIIYSLPEASHVEVSVYNLRGEPVATLVNASQEMGSHTVVWNAEKVGSGVYLIRIRAGRFESMKKCLLVK